MSPIVKRLVLLAVVAVAAVAVLASVLDRPSSPPAATTALQPQTSSTTLGPAATAGPRVPSRVDELQQQLAANPGDKDVMAELGAALLQAKRYAQAADIFYQASQLDPKSARLHQGLGLAFFYQGMMSLAQRELKQAIDLDPNDPEAHFNYALIVSHSAQPDPNAARASWEAVVRLDPDGQLGQVAKQMLASQ